MIRTLFLTWSIDSSLILSILVPCEFFQKRIHDFRVSTLPYNLWSQSALTRHLRL